MVAQPTPGMQPLAPPGPAVPLGPTGLRLPVAPSEQCSSVPDHDTVKPGKGGCLWNYTAGSKLAGWDEVRSGDVCACHTF